MCRISVFTISNLAAFLLTITLTLSLSAQSWTYCASENNQCSFSGTAVVQFGANGQFKYGTFTNGTACTDAVFGDPDVGVLKSCSYSLQSSTSSPAGSASAPADSTSSPASSTSWTYCATENGRCSFTGTAVVQFGANGQFNHGTFTNGTACTDSVFGDPDIGVIKQCSYSLQSSSNLGTSSSSPSTGSSSPSTAPSSPSTAPSSPSTAPSSPSTGSSNSNQINVQSFGAVGDGVHDDTAAIQAALAALQPGQTLYFPPGTYLQGTTNGDDARFMIQNQNHVTILGNNATITASPSMSNSPNHSGFWILNSSNITINGITYDGRLDVRTPTQDDTPPTNMQNAFAVYDNSSNIVIENSTATRAMMDGFFVGVGYNPNVVPANVQLINDVSTYNYRQGLSVVGVNQLTVSGGQYSFTGALGSGKGTPPQSGIDLECDSQLSFTNTNVLMENLTVTGNSGVGVSFATKTIGAHLTNSTISNNAAAGVTMSADSSNNFVDDSTFFGNRYLGNWSITGSGNSEANNTVQ